MTLSDRRLIMSVRGYGWRKCLYRYNVNEYISYLKKILSTLRTTI